MKITNPTAFALVCLLAQATAKKDFTPPKHGSGNDTDSITTAASFDASGVKMTVCPSGDCATGKFMKLSVTSITELDAKGATVVSVDKIKPKQSDWTAITTSVVDGVNVSSTTFVAAPTVGSTNTVVNFNLTASIYQGDATVQYGDQSLSVPAGALKFTVDISGWKFTNTANTLTLAVLLDAKGPNGKALDKPKKKSNSTDDSETATVERVDMGDSMFMDAPTYAILDGTQTNLINSSVVVSGGDTSFEWVFSSFTKTLHYDPVLGEDTSTSTSSSGSSASASASSSGSESSSTSSASKLSLSGLAATCLAMLAYNFF